MHNKTLIESLEISARTDKGITFIDRNKDLPVTYRQLYNESLMLLYQLQERELRPGDKLLFQIEEPRSFLTFFWACQLGGIIPVPVTVGTTPEHRLKVQRVWEITEKPPVIASPDLLHSFTEHLGHDSPNLQTRELLQRLWDADEMLSGLSEKGIPHTAHPDDTALIQFSSGSTGDPKGVILTHRNLLINIEDILTCSAAAPSDRSLSWMPLTHDMGLIGFHLSPLVGQMNQWMMQPSLFLLRPHLWLHKAHEYQITQICSPNFGYKHFMSHFNPQNAIDWDLSSIRYIFNGAEPISPQLAQDFLALLEPYHLQKKAMFPVYGMAEASVAVAFPPVDEELQAVYVERKQLALGKEVKYSSPDSETSIGFVDVGYPIAHLEVRICDDTNTPLGESYVGNIQIKGGNVTRGYYRNAAATKQAFTEDGWLLTGDLGFMRQGRLVITGRKKDIIFVNGRNYFPHDLEWLAQEVEGIELGKIAICGITNQALGRDDVVAFLQHRGRGDSYSGTVWELKKHISKKMGLELTCILPVRHIPKTTSGKLQRYKLAEMYVNGDFADQVLHYEELLNSRAEEIEKEPPADELESQMAELWSDVLGQGTLIGVTDLFADYGGDSLKAAVLLARIHRQFHVEIPTQSFSNDATVRSITDYVRNSEASLYVPITHVEPADHYPVSPSQRRMYIQEQFGGAGTAYNMPFAIKIEGALDVVQLGRSLQRLIQRHESLRTTFAMVDGDVRQVVHPSAEIQIRSLTASEHDVTEVLKQLIRPFDLHVSPLIRSFLIEVQGSEAYKILLIDIHHICSDGISAQIMLQEWLQLYQGKELPPLDLQYRDYAVWTKQQWKGADLDQARLYWSERLKGEIPVLEMPLDGSRPHTKTFDGDTSRFVIPGETAEQLRNFMKSRNVSLYELLLTAYSIFLHSYTRQEDMIVGALVAGRQHADLEQMLGAFVNYVPVRFQIDARLTFDEYIKQATAHMQEDFGNQQYPFDEIVALTGSMTEPSRNPLFDTMVILHNQMDMYQALASDAIKATYYPLPGCTSKLDFKLDVFVSGDSELEGVWEYNTNLFRKETVERFSVHLLRLLDQVILNPNTRLGDLRLLTDEEQTQLLKANNPAPVPYAENQLIHEWIEHQAKIRPEQTAAIFDDGRLSYGELNARANQLARVLRARGVKPDSITAIALDRSTEMIIGITAILKAGGAYLPIAPDAPAERVRYMLEDSAAKLLLVRGGGLGDARFDGEQFNVDQYHVDEPFDVERISLDDESLYQGDASDLPPAAHARNLAYVIYTSGSTGNPKGVMIEHHSVINRIAWMQKKYPLTAEDVILQKTAFTFDVSVWELFWWAQAGAAVHFLVPGGEKDPEQIIQAIETNQVTTMHFVPSMLHLFLAHLEARPERLERLQSLRYVFASGEALLAHQVDRFQSLLGERYGTKLINLYGPTEATVDVSYFECRTGLQLSSIPIGKPIDNTELYVVDSHLQLLPPGIPGELCIGGAGLARGYLGRPELSEEKFRANPFRPGTRMYRTGDLAKLLPDGNIEYLGRLDHQVKIRGYRIELGEIEHHLLQHEAITEAAAIVKSTGSEHTDLYAYFVADENLDTTELRAFLKTYVPDYMVPAYFVQLPSMPLSDNGKINRKALINAVSDVSLAKEYAAPRTAVETALAQIWQEVLNVERPGIDDDFFELGGQSLKAAQTVSKIHQIFQVELPLAEMFDRLTIRELAGWIEQAEQQGYEPIAAVESGSSYPLSSAQSRLYILDRMEGIGTAYNLPFAIEVRGRLQVDRVKESFQAIVNRHETLRTSFSMQDGELRQEIMAAHTVELPVTFSAAAEENVDAAIHSFIRPFDLHKAPLFRVEIIALSEERHVIVCDMHHIISDGISIIVLMEEFIQLYAGNELPQPNIQFKDYTNWMSQRLTSDHLEKQEVYWREVLQQPLPSAELPHDTKRASALSFKGDRYTFELDPGVNHQIKSLAKETNTTLYMLLLAVCNVLLAQYTGQQDIIIGSPVSGRNHPDLQKAIGMFVNTLAMRNYPEASKSFRDFLQEVKANSLSAFEHQEYPLELLLQKLNISREMNRNPLFDVLFVVQNIGIQEHWEAAGLEFSRSQLINPASKFDLTIEVIETVSGLSFALEYNTDLFHRDTIERLGVHLLRLLDQILTVPDTRLGDLKLLTDEEQSQLLQANNPSPVPYAENQLIHEWIEAQAKIRPEQIAAIFDDGKLSYGKLNARANQLARVLRSRGVKPDTIIAIALERSPEMIIGITAILKAGGAYLPIAPDAPAERVRYMLEDSAAKLLLVRGDQLGHVEFNDEQFNNEQFDVERISLDDESLYQGDASDLPPAAHARNLAYVIYTSGSTGNPKGVMIEHHSVINRIAWMQKAYPLTAEDVILQKTAFTFDVSVWELFWWAQAGAAVHFLVPGGEKDPEQIIQAIETSRVTTMHFVPSMLHLFLAHLEARPERLDRLRSLRYVFTSGEALLAHQVERFQSLLSERYGTNLINLYGPTEATVDVSYFECRTGLQLSSIPIGKPIDNTELYVVDSHLRLLPPGIPGELCIGGAGLARGYLGRPELSEEKFTANPFRPGTRMYRTGDLAKLLPDGNIEYLGRLDHQVKIRGYRIELGEIEHKLLEIEGVQEAAVLAKEDGGGNPYLCAFLVTKEQIPSSIIRASLSRALPDYMIPSQYAYLPEMPLSANGKLDRRQLQHLQVITETDDTYTAAQNELEEQLVMLWQQLLGRERIGVHEHFFEIGGHSLLLLQMHTRLEASYPGLIQVTDLFAYPTISKLAAFMKQAGEQHLAAPLSYLTLPTDYFVQQTAAAQQAVYKLQLGELETRLLGELEQSGHAKRQVVLLASLAYLLAAVTKSTELTIVHSDSLRSFQMLELQMGQVSEIASLISMAQSALSASQTSELLLEQIQPVKVKETPQAVLPLFYQRGAVPVRDVHRSRFDIQFSYYTENDQIHLLCEYNDQRLSKLKMKELFGQYIRIIRTVIQQYAGEIQFMEAAAASEDRKVERSL
ncbi:amino acid adenylation domain-containing protein [Paenibacillus sp. SN-8-1]|uniref:amino acid adenylation domain-containing protein n=1 Tax=Paenibacillus sp. SN-8-1 TaxID=3435409 RepID=UPI003D9AAE9D